MKKIVGHNPDWAFQYKAESESLHNLLGNTCVRSHHIGSTAIAHIPAKPIIDILMEVSCLNELDALSNGLSSSNYEVRGEYGILGRRYFKKKATVTISGINLHCYELGSFQIKRHLAFKNYLIAKPEVAQEYAKLKLNLCDAGGVLKANYQDDKKPFVDGTSLEALRYFERQS